MSVEEPKGNIDDKMDMRDWICSSILSATVIIPYIWGLLNHWWLWQVLGAVGLLAIPTALAIKFLYRNNKRGTISDE